MLQPTDQSRGAEIAEIINRFDARVLWRLTAPVNIYMLHGNILVGYE